MFVRFFLQLSLSGCERLGGQYNVSEWQSGVSHCALLLPRPSPNH